MFLKYYTILSIGLLLLSINTQAQRVYHEIAGDTIITYPGILGKQYLLDGKKLNLTVMEWFMTDYPRAHDNIQPALWSEQLSLMSYSLGTLFGFSGVLILETDRPLGINMVKLGGIGIGGGLILQLISNSYQKKAVMEYNRCIKANHLKESFNLNLGIQENGLGMRVDF